MKIVIVQSMVALFAVSAFGQGPTTKEVPATKNPEHRVSFKENNDTGLYKAASHVRSTGNISVNMTVTDSRIKNDRNIQIFIAIYERDMDFPSRFKRGNFIKSVVGKEIMKSEKAKPMIGQFKAEIKMQPGEYVYYVFLCDPDVPVVPKDLPINPPDPPKIPGLPLRIKVCTATVD